MKGVKACRVDLRVCKPVHPRVTAGLTPGKGGGLASGRACTHRNPGTNHFTQFRNRKEFTQVICVRDISNAVRHLLNQSLSHSFLILATLT